MMYKISKSNDNTKLTTSGYYPINIQQIQIPINTNKEVNPYTNKSSLKLK